jgi:serine/threonine protein kinase
MDKKLLENNNNTPEDPEEVFQKLEILGEGSFGTVYKVLHRETGNIVAAKILNVDEEIDR